MAQFLLLARKIASHPCRYCSRAHSSGPKALLGWRRLRVRCRTGMPSGFTRELASIRPQVSLTPGVLESRLFTGSRLCLRRGKKILKGVPISHPVQGTLKRVWVLSQDGAHYGNSREAYHVCPDWKDTAREGGAGSMLVPATWWALNVATHSSWWKWSGTGKPRQVQGGQGWVLGFVFRCLRNPGWGCG